MDEPEGQPASAAGPQAVSSPQAFVQVPVALRESSESLNLCGFWNTDGSYTPSPRAAVLALGLASDSWLSRLPAVISETSPLPGPSGTQNMTNIVGSF